MLETPDQQISLTDPDARAMTSQSHSAYTVGYNVQSVVDTKNHLIVTHEVTNVGIDRDQLSSIAGLACEALDVETIEVLTDPTSISMYGSRGANGVIVISTKGAPPPRR